MFTQLKYPHEIAKDIAQQEKSKRKRRKITQKELSERSGVSLASIKRFEQTGEISFVSLLQIAVVLDELDSFASLFEGKKYESIQEVINERNQFIRSKNSRRRRTP